jgi:hypothetical protein
MRTERAQGSVRRRVAAVAVAVATIVAVIATAAHSGATVPAVDQLTVARDRAAEVARDITDAEAQRAQTEQRIAAAEAEIAALVTRVHAIQSRIRARAADLYIRHAWSRFDVVMSTRSVVAGARASHLTSTVGDRERSLATQLEHTTHELEERRESLHAQRAALMEQLDALVALREELDRQIDAAVRSSRRAEAHPAASWSQPAPSGDAVWERFRECTFAFESGGDYGIVSPGGTYHGAWQFLPSTWNAVAGRMGRHDLVGVLPSLALPTDQDSVAHQLWLESGNRPWGGRC